VQVLLSCDNKVTEACDVTDYNISRTTAMIYPNHIRCITDIAQFHNYTLIPILLFPSEKKIDHEEYIMHHLVLHDV